MSISKKVSVAVIVVAAVSGLWYWYAGRTPELPYEAEPVGRLTVAQTVSVTGELRPVDYADLSFRQVGRVSGVFVKEGDVVEAGAKLAELDMSTLRSQLRDAELSLLIAEANERLARRGWDGLKPEEKDAKKLTTEQYRERIRTIRSEMSEGILTAPISGTVSKLDARLGETVSVGRVVARIIGGTGMILTARVPEADVAKLSVGMGAKATFDALSNDEVFEASIADIQSSATVVSDVVSYETDFHLVSRDGRLLDGMSATIDIETAKAEQVLAVPFRALSREGEKSFVEIPEPDGTLKKREISIGIEGDEGTVEVKSGLQEGELVVVSKKK